MTRNRAGTDWRRRLAELRKAYLSQLPEKLGPIEASWEGLTSGPWRWEPMTAMRHAVHNITGSSAMHGLETISQRAAELEEYIDLLLYNKALPANDQRSQMNFLLEALRRAVEEANA